MTNALDTLIALSKEYIRLLEERKKENLEYVLILYQKLELNVQD